MTTFISGTIGPAIQLLKSTTPQGTSSRLIHLAFSAVLLRRETVPEATLSQRLDVGQALHHFNHVWQRLLWGQLLASFITVSLLVPESLRRQGRRLVLARQPVQLALASQTWWTASLAQCVFSGVALFERNVSILCGLSRVEQV